MNGPTFLGPFARSAAPPQPSSRRPPTPKSCPCISKKSAVTSHRARTPPLFSTALDIISPPASPCPTTSHLFTSRLTHPNSIPSKTSGNICAATSSPTRSTKITTISSKKPAKHGCSSPTTRSRSLQSPHANGQRSIFSAVGIISLFPLLCARRGGGLLGRRDGGHRGAGQSLDHRARRVARALIAHRIEQWGRRAGTADQGFGVGQHDRVVPRPLHDEGQFEYGCLGLVGGHQSGRALEIEFARRNRG